MGLRLASLLALPALFAASAAKPDYSFCQSITKQKETDLRIKEHEEKIAMHANEVIMHRKNAKEAEENVALWLKITAVLASIALSLLLKIHITKKRLMKSIVQSEINQSNNTTPPKENTMPTFCEFQLSSNLTPEELVNFNKAIAMVLKIDLKFLNNFQGSVGIMKKDDIEEFIRQQLPKIAGEYEAANFGVPPEQRPDFDSYSTSIDNEKITVIMIKDFSNPATIYASLRRELTRLKTNKESKARFITIQEEELV